MRTLLLLGVVLLLAGCAGTEVWSGDVYCVAGRDCDIKMGRAYDFVEKHSLVGMRVANSRSIMTKNTQNENIFLEFTVHKKAVDQKNDLISMSVMCASFTGCTGDPHAMADAMLKYVNP